MDGEHTQLCFWRIDGGAKGSYMHKHDDHEQLGIIFRGALDFRIGQEDTQERSYLNTGDVYIAPKGVWHGDSIFIGVWLVNARLFPMAVSMFPLLKSRKQPKWKYYLSCHFLAVSSWLIMKKDYRTIHEDFRIDFWMGIGTATWSIAILSTVLGFMTSDYLSKDMMIGLAIVNPVYFFCMLLGSIKNIVIGTSVILGTILGPVFYLISPEWCILYGGVSAGIVAFIVGEFNG